MANSKYRFVQGIVKYRALLCQQINTYNKTKEFSITFHFNSKKEKDRLVKEGAVLLKDGDSMTLSSLHPIIVSGFIEPTDHVMIAYTEKDGRFYLAGVKLLEKGPRNGTLFADYEDFNDTTFRTL